VTTVTRERLEEVLAALPPTADETAALFEELGIKGVTGDACNCPVANYIKDELGLSDDAYVSFYMDANLYPEGHGRGEYITTQSPDHLFRFARFFDRRDYPALIAE
jgi:hypothetical protein